MLDANTTIGAASGNSSFCNMIISTVEAVASQTVNGFAGFVHDPVQLSKTVEQFRKVKIPEHFPDAVMLRRINTQKLDDLWRCPLNMTCPSTIPLPWTVLESKCEQAINSTTFQFGIERRAQFIGRNYIKIVLPEIDCTRIVDSSITSADQIMSDPEHIYLGAWHRDLVPRLIEKVVFFTRANNHQLFEYTGYDIYAHNIIFGNKHKEMNDLMAGEDKFELCYDPYRVDGSAMGIASFKGIDAFAEYELEEESGFIKHQKADSVVLGGVDRITDYFQKDTTMDDGEFREFYRKNVWYEAPVAQNYYARHSIHARRLFHAAKDILIPLDILPFGYSIGSSLPTAALAADTGHITVQLFSNWLDRAFYLTKCSDIPSLHPLVNHTHFKAGETTSAGDVVQEGDPRIDWVNDRSIGRYGDPSFVSTTAQGQPGFDAVAKFTNEGSVLGGAAHARENIVPTTVDFSAEGVTAPGFYKGGVMGKNNGVLKTTGNWTSVVRTSTAAEYKSAGLTDASGKTAFLHPVSTISSDFAASIQSQIGVKLLQVGFDTIGSLRDLLTKLPNIYITNEWEDKDVSIAQQGFTIKSNLYTQGMLLWFLPVDPRTGIESTRVYPNHLHDHEKPVIAGLKMEGEQSQGTTIYDWTMLNQLTPAQIELSNPLLENMGLITFSPSLVANEFPFAFYDNNLCGALSFEFMQGKGSDKLVNLRNGKLKFINIGINGCGLVNLSFYKIVF